MPHILENVFTAVAVHAWSPIVRTAWRERKNRPDGYLRALPPPGQRLATGPWTAQEVSLFDARLAEFRANAWPLSYWGIFSLTLPHRTGSQCRSFYRQSQWYRPEEEAASPPLAAVRACLAAARPQTQQLWTSEVAAQVEARVNAWLQGKSTPGSSDAKAAAAAGGGAAAAAPQPLSSFAFRQPEHPQPKSGLLPRLANQKKSTAAAGPPKKKKKVAAAPKPPPPPKRRTIDSDSDGDDEFVAGTLRRLPVLQQQQQQKRTAPVAPAAAAAAKARARPAAGGKRAPRAARDGTIVKMATEPAGDDFDAAAAAAAAADAVTVIRLDKDRNLGWARQVRPYVPPDAIPVPPPGSLVLAPDLLRFDFPTLGAGAFSGVIVNAPLSADPALGVTPTQLATMALPGCLAPDAIVCVWASKSAVGETVAAMSKAWGCKYVENLTWVHLVPGGNVARAPALLIRGSHATLVMGRRGKGSLELRHQRSPDVIVEPALGGGRFPDAVREMLETLLPEGKGGDDGGGGEKLQGAPRFLEVAFHGAEPGARPGWVKLVQAPRGEG